MTAGFKELDGTVTLAEQMQEQESGPIVLINLFTVAPEDADALIDAWAHDAAFMKEQPGYISTQLHRGLSGSTTFMNYAVWESAETFAAAFGNPEFQSRIAQYPSSAVAAPHLFRKLAVTGFCVS